MLAAGNGRTVLSEGFLWVSVRHVVSIFFITARSSGRGLTLNQRVQGSSPCAPTNVVNGLYQKTGC